MQHTDIVTDLTKDLTSHYPFHNYREVLEYIIFPPGKLFRPKLVHAMAQDLGGILQSHRHLSSFVEIHHAYTLVHDDLPSMDNDDYRRGRLSTHKKFNEWKAILAGDALLNASFGILSKVEASKLPALLKFISWATGPKGLILGQVMDMGLESQLSLKNLLQMHELKTSRLIQICLVGSAHLSKNLTISEYKDFMKLGNAIGISFQLLDDLKEIAQDEVNEHEKEVNPYFHYGEKAVIDLIHKQNKTIQLVCEKYELENIDQMYQKYWQNCRDIISKKIEIK